MRCYPVAGSPDLTLDDVLHIKHPGKPRWSPDGTRLGFLWDDGGLVHLWVAELATGNLVQISQGGTGVTEFSWSDQGRLAWAQGDGLWLDGGLVFRSGPGPIFPRWAPGGGTLGFVRDGRFVWWDLQRGIQEFALPERVGTARLCVSPLFRWSPRGTKVAAMTQDPGRLGLVVFRGDGEVEWRYAGPGLVAAYAWLDEGRLHATVHLRADRREHYLVDLSTGAMEPLVTEEGLPALGTLIEPQPDPRGERVLYVLYHDGWAHLYLMELGHGGSGGRTLRQLTSGEHEDFAFAGDRPQWAPDGESFVYASNRGALQQRHLWHYHLQTASERRLTDMPGTNFSPVWRPDGKALLFAHCGPHRSTDFWLMEPVGAPPRQVTSSMPPSWTAENTAPPRHITFPSKGGLQVHADLYLPKGFDPNQRYPVLVYIHGGVTMQMRYGWYPGQGDAERHAWHQYLLHRGYVVMTVDYRGSIGYGLAYQTCLWGRVGVDDLADCVSAAAWLKQQPWVHPGRIAIWGQSYGGYLTLAALTKAPGVFAVGISTAGVWDWEPLLEWRAPFDPGMDWLSRFRILAYLEGEEARRAWFEAMPKNFVHQLQRPLFTLQGTDDEAVPIGQQDQIVADCMKAGKDFAAAYYPGERHRFVWRHAQRDMFTRVEQVLERYLKHPEKWAGQRASL